jgi:Ulp1 family protease
MTARSFQTLGAGRWLDDEVINYFVAKWCTNSKSVLGLSTFFACRNLFENGACINPKQALQQQDEHRAKRWCMSAQVIIHSTSERLCSDFAAEEAAASLLGHRFHTHK